MSLVPKQQIAILSGSGVMAAFSLASILNFTDPYKSSWLVFGLFYLSIILLSFSALTLISFFIKRWLWPKIYLNDLSLSLRHGFLISVLITLTIALQINGVLFWWLELSLMLFFVCIEIFINIKT